jgi:hypothetical protein
VTNDNGALFSIQPAVSPNGTLTFTSATNANGTAHVTVVLHDDGGTANGGVDTSAPSMFTITVTPVNDPPMLTSFPTNINVQYSDPISTVTITATDVDSAGSKLTASVMWQTNGGVFQTSLPSGLTFTQTTTAANSRNWTISGKPQLPPGSYLIRITGKDDQNASTTLDVPLNVTPEDADATYTGDLFVTTSSASVNKTTVTLSATIQDISAVPSDPATDPYPGDIRKARVTFIDRGDNSIIASNLPVGLVTQTDTRTGTATYQWNVNLGTNDSKTITVGIIVSGYYVRDSAADDTVISVSKPLSGKFVLGSGYLVLSHSAGLFAGDSGSRASFGFIAAGTKAGTLGEMSLVVRHSGHVYQVNATQLTALSFSGKQAALNGTARILDITRYLCPVLLDSDATFQFKMTDNGTPGTKDTLAITIWNKAGGLWFSSDWDGTKSLEQNLGGGNLIVAQNTASLVARETDPESFSLSLVILPATNEKAAVVRLQFPVNAETDYVIERSRDLQYWSPVRTVRSAEDEEYSFEDEVAAGPRFYRVSIAQTPVPIDPERDHQ